jgi:hypothetical protein
MNSQFAHFKTKALAAAVSAALGSGAYAVTLNPHAVGQVLLFPYYTARSVDGVGQNSVLSITNATNDAKVVYVRFFEAKAGRFVYGKHVYLSGNDMWTAVVSAAPTGGAQLTTDDRSCTVPSSPPPPTAVSGPGFDVPPPTQFVNFAYAFPNDDGAGASLDRTLEGYAEVIEMGTLTGATASAVTHVNGVPGNCAAVNQPQVVDQDLLPGTGGLTGTLEIVNPVRGTSFITQAVALADFAPRTPLFLAPGSIRPSLGDALPPDGAASVDSVTYVFSARAAQSADAVSALLMHDTVIDPFQTEDGAVTSYVFTFPTKSQYVGAAGALAPFQRNFGSTGSCDDITVAAYDRDERPSQSSGSLCWATNVVTINGGNVFGSAVATNINVPFASGWTRTTFRASDFAGVHSLPVSSVVAFDARVRESQFLGGATFQGLPVIGFAAISVSNGFVQVPDGTVLSNNGGIVPHASTVNVRVPSFTSTTRRTGR